MRHFSYAVPTSKLVKGHMGQTPHQMLRKNQSQLYKRNCNRNYTGRIVTTSHTFNGVSTNWKLDVYKHKNYSYAQVVKCPRGGASSATPSMATSRTSPNQGKSGQRKISGQHRDRKSSHKNVNNTHVETGPYRCQAHRSKVSLDHIAPGLAQGK